MGAIFLSYAREDRGFAERLSRVLEGAGHSVWWDRRLDGGEEFGAEIEAALAGCDVVLVAWSKDSVKSRWVRDEAAVGGDTGRLVPVSIDGSLPPMGFRQFHTLDLTGWRGAKRDGHTAELLRSVDRRLKAKPTVPVTTEIRPGRRFAFPNRGPLWAVAAALILVIAAGMTFFLSQRQSTRGPLSKPQIALVPFSVSSADPQLRELAAQTRESLSHTLSQSGVPVRMLSSAPQDRGSAGDFLLAGELSHNADKVVATIRLDEAAHGVTVYTTRLEAAGDDIRNLPERIGARMAVMLSDGSNLITLDKRYRTDPAILAELLANTDDQLQRYQISKRVAAKAPTVPSAQIGVAFYTGFVLSELPREERAQAVIAARHAAKQGLALAPDFGDTYATWCLLHSETELSACEDQLHAGNRVDPDAPYLNLFLGGLLEGVGRFDEADDDYRLTYTHDPYNSFKISVMLRLLEFAGEKDQAHELYQNAVRWWPEFRDGFFRNRMFGLLERGDFEGVRRLEEEMGAKNLAEGYTDTRTLAAAVQSKSPAVVKQACAGTKPYLLMLRCMIAFAAVGDLDGAYAVADKLYPRRVGRTPAETERIWLDDPDGAGPGQFITSPGAAPMRRDPRYLQLAERTGLLAYWRGGRIPDFCRKQPEAICSQLLKRS
jgi:TolB-like protein